MTSRDRATIVSRPALPMPVVRMCSPRGVVNPYCVKRSPLRTCRLIAHSTQGTLAIDNEDEEWFERYISDNVLEVYSVGELQGELARAKDSLVVVYFFTDTCHACHAIHNKLGRLARSTPDVVYLKVHYRRHQDLCERLHIDQLPFFHLYKGARGRVAAFSASVATFARLQGAVRRERGAMCSRGRRRVATRLAGPPPRLTTKERMKMKLLFKKAMDGTALALPSVEATRWVEHLDRLRAEELEQHRKGAM
eukprot:CAMPEP_0114231954 /NCGR_PEP_ID=MMETSP0058-20121206/4337_1 /TAXON_ID=36894 /ORGANISM="Pyramimonas parkeae, CCMP726" /LENGTH=250 /DNA_ID=CAMNT_0001343373 /DNA_START=160 /DNA_END=912 /DNA_ORIENTATION=+